MIRIVSLLLQTAFTALGVVVLVFISLRFTPGNPLDIFLGEQAQHTSKALETQILADLGLNEPAPRALVHYLKKILRGDLGTSVAKKKPVLTLLKERIPNTLLLTLTAAFITNLIAIAWGLAAAANPGGKLSQVLFWTSTLMQSLPSFWLAPLLIVAFSLRWPWLPVSGFEEPTSLILPTLTLALAMTGLLARTTETALADCLRSDYIRTAHSKGLSETRVLLTHALPNALPAIATVSMLQLGHLLAGAIVTETIFDWPGLGTLIYDAISQRDYPTVQGGVLFIALGYVALNSFADSLAQRFSATDLEGHTS